MPLDLPPGALRLLCLDAAVVFKCSEVKTEEAAANEVAEEADEDNKKAKPAPWEVCEMYGPGECADNKDRCSLCKQKTSGKELCFRPHVAAKLPPCEPLQLAAGPACHVCCLPSGTRCSLSAGLALQTSPARQLCCSVS